MYDVTIDRHIHVVPINITLMNYLNNGVRCVFRGI